MRKHNREREVAGMRAAWAQLLFVGTYKETLLETYVLYSIITVIATIYGTPSKYQQYAEKFTYFHV